MNVVTVKVNLLPKEARLLQAAVDEAGNDSVRLLELVGEKNIKLLIRALANAVPEAVTA